VCPAGSVTNTVSSSGATSCTACVAGQYTNASTAACTTCTTGSVTDTVAAAGAISCTACAVGQYNNASTATCAVCPAGSVTNTVSSTAQDCNVRRHVGRGYLGIPGLNVTKTVVLETAQDCNVRYGGILRCKDPFYLPVHTRTGNR
jgi:hypothetical protein